MTFGRQRILVCGVVFLASAVAALPAAGAETPITLDSAIRLAIERNLDLRNQSFVPALAGTDLRRARAVYNPNVSSLVDHQEERAPVDPTSSAAVQRRSVNANFSVDQRVPSGGTLSGAYTNLLSWNGTNTFGNAFSQVDQPQLSLSFSQPVLQGLGREVTERDIADAADAREEAFAGWHFTALTVVGSVRDQYFALVQALENLKTLRASLAVAVELQAQNEARVRAGVLAAANLLDSELGVDQRQFDLVNAERVVSDQSDRLRLAIQLPGTDQLVPRESFPREEGTYGEEEEIRTAYAKRPDLLQARIALRARERDERVSKNLALPSLAVTGTVGLEGLGTTYPSAVEDVGRGTFPFWSVGLAFTYPIGNDAAGADVTASRLRVRQAKLQIQTLEANAAVDVRSALRGVTSNKRQIEVAEKGVKDAEVRLASYVKRQKLGLANTKDVLQVEADLTAARVGLANARAAYQSALTQLWTVTGELLERQGIEVRSSQIEQMAWKESP